MIREDIELSVIEHLDFTLPCEGQNHPAGTDGHVTEQPASYLVVLPCGLSLMYCAGRAAWVREANMLHCNVGCGGLHCRDTVRFLPL